MAQRWRVKPQGIQTVQQGDWWVPKSPATPAARPAVNRLVPREWQGSAGIIGGYQKQPRLDPTAWEWRMNPENGRWFARPRTELTGLDPQQVADVRAQRTQADQQGQRIQGAYNQFADQAQQNANTTAAALTGLAGQVGAGYVRSDPTADALARTGQQATSAAALPSLARLSDLPNVARSEGLTNLQAFLGQTRQADSELIKAYRGQNADAQQAASEQQFKDRQLRATLAIASGDQATTARGQDITAQTRGADRLASLQKAQAQLETKLQIARENNQTSRANTITRALAANKRQQQKAKGASRSDMRQWTQMARELYAGVPTGDKDPNGQQLRDYYNPTEIFHQLVASGATKARAKQIVKAVTGQTVSFDPVSPGLNLPNLGW